MPILENFDKKSLGLFLILYFIILFQYFVDNNIPIQIDSRILIVIAISLIFFLLIGISVYLLAGSIERIILIKLNQESKHKIFKNFDENVLLILFPIVLVFYIINLGDNIRLYHVLIFLLLIVYIMIFPIIEKRFKTRKWLYLNSILIIFLFFHGIFAKNQSFIISLFLLLIIISIILYYLKSNENQLNEKFELNLDDLALYNTIKTKYLSKSSFKMGNFLLIFLILIIFFLWDTVTTKNKVNNFITQKVLHITKIGSFKEKLVIDNKLEDVFTGEIKNSNANSFTIEAEIIWENDDDIFIKYNNTSIRIKKDFILMNEYINN